jgi:indolepyruvate ferredoxin oxidoreductase alpha subunit
MYNHYMDGRDKSLGIITSGIGINYLMENYRDTDIPFPVLKIGQYPIPVKMIRQLYDECREILVLEEGYPLIEEMLRGLINNGIRIRGRLDGAIPRAGELNPNIVAIALGMPDPRGLPVPGIVVGRPPSLCFGCPHIDSFKALNEALGNLPKGHVFSDIGCYTLGAFEPYNSIDTCVDMGASITMAKGASDAGLSPSIAVIGDSTFTHSGITGLLDAVNDNSPITVIILDNDTTAMTGGQKSPATGHIEEICKGIGVKKEHIHIIRPLKKHHEENLKIMKDEIAYKGVSVIIPRRECVVTLDSRMRDKFKTKKIVKA